MTNSVQEQREALGKRLREIRRRAGVTGRELARVKGWHESKISKLEYGVTRPSDSDIRAYCRHCNADDQLDDLLATLHNIDTAYVEWRQQLRTGMANRQRESNKAASRATFIRNWEPAMVSGLLQTADYAAAVMSNVIAFYQIPNDLDEAVTARMERQRILYQRNKRFHFLLGEQALYTTFGDDQVMIGQLDRLHSIIGMPRVTLGIVPREAEGLVVVENFFMFDDRLVKVEGHSAGITITQPREITLYGHAFNVLAGQSVTGDQARALIHRARATRMA
ncbi:XRE family transcriptional regulator [Nocardia yunnanensis]|uniref:XRE family transcriptional regulator n=1 Tax=Nocardia yunnanensis TaxID=2382165 RepID=A0A386ZMI5_9NOCA|nr:helix-turn-helix transcriptional regulator [Nocardia yunnanensis]AYF78384.1 XRE family transcriptional regulator [Nocardia yunnanensis]